MDQYRPATGLRWKVPSVQEHGVPMDEPIEFFHRPFAHFLSFFADRRPLCPWRFASGNRLICAINFHLHFAPLFSLVCSPSWLHSQQHSKRVNLPEEWSVPFFLFLSPYSPLADLSAAPIPSCLRQHQFWGREYERRRQSPFHVSTFCLLYFIFLNIEGDIGVTVQTFFHTGHYYSLS